MFTEEKQKIANEIKELCSRLESSICQARDKGLEVEIDISKFEPLAPIQISIFEKVWY